MDTILDLDLDFFVEPAAYFVGDSSPRRNEDEYKTVSIPEAERFLSKQCHLSKKSKLPGREVRHHVEAFATWREWIDRGILKVPFDIVHVDAHSDMGMGEAGWVYLMSELLALAVEQRRYPKIAPTFTTSGSYLPCVIANRWVRRLTLVFPSYIRDVESPDGSKAPGDMMNLFFRNRDFNTKTIELEHRPAEDIDMLIYSNTIPPPISTEPPVPCDWVSASNFEFGGFTHVLLADSPPFTPPSADKLLPFIRSYFTPS